MHVFSWIQSWWITWQVWRHADAEARAILTGPLDPDDFEEVYRP